MIGVSQRDATEWKTWEGEFADELAQRHRVVGGLPQ
jgi:hypothetical protein